MQLHVGFADESDGEWKSIAKLDPSPEQTHRSGTFTWNCHITLPTGEEVLLGAVYAQSNRGLNIVAKQNGLDIVSVGGFKLKDTTYDPTVIFRTIGGAYVQVMLGV
jgi:hypothetical protein